MPQRNADEKAQDKQDKFFRQKEGDIFLKHDESDTSTAIVVRGNQIVAHTNEGKFGLKIQDNGTIYLQGNVDVKSDSFGISRYTWPIMGQQVTENPSDTDTYTRLGGSKMTQIGGSAGIAIPHTHAILDHTHEITPGYLRKMPDLGMLAKVMGFLEKFLNI